MNPLVSVITPTYNRANYLPETIDSVLMQDYIDFEYIILDDGSTDNTSDIVSQYDDIRIRYFWHSNIGEARTINKGFNVAKGKYIIVINSDDKLLPGLISKSVDMMEKNPDVIVGYADWYVMDENSNLQYVTKTMENFTYRKMIQQFYCVPGPAAIFHKRAIDLEKGRDPTFRYVGDVDFWFRVGMHGRFQRIPEALSAFRVHQANLTKQQTVLPINNERILLLNKLFSNPNLPAEIASIKRQSYASAHYMTGLSLIHNRRQAKYHFIKSIILKPLRCYPIGRPRQWGLMLKTMGIPIGMLKYPIGLWRKISLLYQGKK